MPHYQNQERPFGRAPNFPSASSSTFSTRPHRLRITREQLQVQVPESSHTSLSSEEQERRNFSAHYQTHNQVSNDLAYFTIHHLSEPPRDAIHNSQEHFDLFTHLHTFTDTTPHTFITLPVIKINPLSSIHLNFSFYLNQPSTQSLTHSSLPLLTPHSSYLFVNYPLPLFILHEPFN